ncbi:hypothetical protein CIPAW_01G026300 [Carya illinoinensis]|uniref:Uncharacterized protein n=1 Tax=Carya illinoinensis TaxID=32201 RepID=A0A8T1RH85_CARIL|nr:hypothetical protein CIPAW_01G026300 [Carya illinoinensis]
MHDTFLELSKRGIYVYSSQVFHFTKSDSSSSPWNLLLVTEIMMEIENGIG